MRAITPKNCDPSVKKAIQLLSSKLDYDTVQTFAGLTLTHTGIGDQSTLSKTCTSAAGLNVLRVTGLQTDGTAMTGTLRGAYIDVSNGSTAATGTIRGMELRARTEAPGDTGNNVAVLEGLSISADSKAHNVTTMRAAEFILDGKTAGTIGEAVGLRIANNLQVDKATVSYGLQIYRDSFDYTYDISLSLGGHITGDSYVNQDLRTTASPTFSTVYLTDLTKHRLVCICDDYQLSFVDPITDYFNSTENQITVTDNGDGTATLSTPQDIHTEAEVIFAGITVNNMGLHIVSATEEKDLIIKPISALTADRALKFQTGDSDRTITLSGNPTLADWFDQSVKTVAGPAFVNLHLGATELTCGSINRAIGVLTLEIGGTAEVSITSTTVTFGGSLIIPDAGYIGSVSDTDAIQIEADGDIIMSQDLAISGTLGVTGAGSAASLATTGGDLSVKSANPATTATNIRVSDSAGNLDRILTRDTGNDIYFGDIDANSGKLFLRANGATWQTILEDGKIGFGILNPLQKVHLYQSVNNNVRFLLENPNQEANGQSSFAMDSGGYSWIYYVKYSEGDSYQLFSTTLGAAVLSCKSDGNVSVAGALQIDNVQVVSNRVIDARCDDALNSGDATTDGVIDSLRDAMITHGLIAAA